MAYFTDDSLLPENMEKLIIKGHELHLLDGSHTLTIPRPPDRVFDTDAYMLAESDRSHAKRKDGPLPRLHEHDRAVRRSPDVLHHIERIAAAGPTTNSYKLVVEGPHICARSNESFHGFELMHVAEHEERLNIMRS